MTVTDILLTLVGRQFKLPNGGWLIVGRDMKDNDKLTGWAEEGDILFDMLDRPGPIALLRRAEVYYSSEELQREDIRSAAELVVRYGRKVDGGRPPGEVTIYRGEKEEKLMAGPPEDDAFMEWML